MTVVRINQGRKGDKGDTGPAWSSTTSPGRVPARSQGGQGTEDATLDHIPDSPTRAAVTPMAKVAAETRFVRIDTIDYTDAIFRAASTTVSKTLFALTANQKLSVRSTRPRVAFAGTDIVDVLAQVGPNVAGHEGDYIGDCSLISLVPNASRSDILSGHDLSPPVSDFDVVATFTSTEGTNFGNGSATVLTAGRVWFNFEIITLPDGT